MKFDLVGPFGRPQLLPMNKHKIISFLQSVVAIPILAIASPVLPQTSLVNPTIVINQNNTTTTESPVITTQEEQVRKDRAAKIEALLATYNSPLKGHGMKFVQEAEKNEIDWRLLVAISGQESTYAIHSCKNATYSFLGYGSCRMSFKSIDDAIEKVSASLGGNNPKTAQHYDNKTTIEKLHKYNTVLPSYTSDVVRIMKSIDSTDKIV